MNYGNLFRRLFLVPVFALINSQLFASNVEMADALRESGKIYVVLVITLVILAGMILFLVHLERKISRLEKNS